LLFQVAKAVGEAREKRAHPGLQCTELLFDGLAIDDLNEGILTGDDRGGARAFAEDRNQKSDKFFRVANEVPTLLMILIVILIIVRPA